MPVLAAAEGVSIMFRVVTLDDGQVYQLVATLRPIGQLLLLDRSRLSGSGFEGLAIFRQDGSINRVGFGALALSASKVTNPGRLQNADRDASGLQRADHALFITSGGFADDLNLGIGAQEFKKLSVALCIISQGVEAIGQMKLQRELGNVQADIEDGGVVLTHTCKIRATIMCCCRAQATVRVWDNGRARNRLQDASRHRRMLSAEVLGHTSLD